MGMSCAVVFTPRYKFLMHVVQAYGLVAAKGSIELNV